MLKQKKGQGLPITTIIIVIIGLIVLVVMIALFAGRMGSFSKGVEEIATCANTCKALGNKTASDDSTCSKGIKVPGEYKGITQGCCCK